MRMKRKKNLDERIAASGDYIITMKNDSLDFQDAIKENHLLDFNKIFKKEQPVYLEIGCGKGQFGNTFAHQNPDKNILCVERNRNVLIMAIERRESLGLTILCFFAARRNIYRLTYQIAALRKFILTFRARFQKRATRRTGLQIHVFLKYTSLCSKTAVQSTKRQTICTFLNIQSKAFQNAASSFQIFHLIYIRAILREISKRNMSRSFRHKASPFTDWKQGYNKTQYIIKCLTENASSITCLLSNSCTSLFLTVDETMLF